MPEQTGRSLDYPRRPRASRSAEAVALISLLAVAALGNWMSASAASEDDAPVGPLTAVAARAPLIGACLRAVDLPLDEVTEVAQALEMEAAKRNHLFPDLSVSISAPKSPDEAMIVALWPHQAPRDSEQTRQQVRSPGPCAGVDDGWAFTVTHDLLASGANRLLDGAQIGSDWSGQIDVTFHPAESRVRSTLTFSGPFGISGSCWIDETLSIDGPSGLPKVTTERGDDAGIAGLVACRRFEEEMHEGGAGALAIALFPADVTSQTQAALRATEVEVTSSAVIVRGLAR